MNGVNTPWNKWNDFGGNYDDQWWDNHFAQLHSAGINAVRVWISCNNDNGAIEIGNDGIVSGVSDQHWADLDLFFKTAERHHLYIMATLLSFDHFRDMGKRPDAEKWRNMLRNKTSAASFIQHYTIPFVERYKDNPQLWSIDICNEPEWLYETKECGNLPWDQISYFLALNAVAIHEHSDILVTVGLAFAKYNVDCNGGMGNKISDAFLQNLYPNTNAYLDFWSPHAYDWASLIYGVPFYLSPYGSKPGGFGLDASKPAMIGEFSAKGSKGETPGTENNTTTSDYENAYLNGWQGVMPWTSNGVDANGDLQDIAPATRYMSQKYL